jgi:hypothetical protein
MRNEDKNTGRLCAPVTVIITVWKRNYLQEQLEALLDQTTLPGQIWILQNENHFDVRPLIKGYLERFPSIFVMQSEVNLKCFWRYSMTWHVKDEFVWVLDDDVIPGRKWLEVCCEKCRSLNAVIGCSGRIVPKDDYMPERARSGEILKYFIGDGDESREINYCPEDTVVDYACNSYFFRTEWIKEFWTFLPFSFIHGDDMHLSVSLKLRRNVGTVIPAQLNAESTGNLKKRYGSDQYSSWLKAPFYPVREGVLQNMISTCGWKPILWSQEETNISYNHKK